MSTPPEQLPPKSKASKTALRDVVESGTVPGMAKNHPAAAQQTQPGKPTATADGKTTPPSKPVTKLTVAESLQFEHADLGKLESLVRARIVLEGDGTLQFKPDLKTIQAPGKYPLVAFAGPGKTHAASIDHPFTLEVLRPKATLTLQPVPALEYHPTRDFAALLTGLAACDSGAAPKFDPPLSTVRAAKDYDITVSAPETPKFSAPEPAHLKFAILPADAKFTVGTPADYVFETVTDLRAQIDPHCEGEADEADLFSFAPPLDKVGLKPGPCKVVVTLKVRSNYRPEAPKTVAWKILKKPQSLKVPVIQDHVFDANLEKTFFKKLPQQFEKRPVGLGELCFDPPLNGCKYAENEYVFKVWLAENDLYQKSEVEVLTFKVFMNSMDCSGAFSEWWRGADAKRKTKLGSEKTAKVKYCGDPVAKIPPPDNYTSKAQLFTVLNNASAGLKSRAEIWAALGYPSLANSSAWVLGSVPNTSKGGKAHLTISYGNIITPTTLAFWTQSDNAIFDGLFKGPTNIPSRVHASLEDQPEAGRNYHVFLGNAGYVSGDNNPRQAEGFDGQVGEMFAALDNFKTTMISRIAANKAALGTAS
jgi:hypothetical protein